MHQEKTDKNNAFLNSFFIINNDFPLPIFENQMNLILFCYNIACFETLPARLQFEKVLKKMFLKVGSNSIYLAARNDNGVPCLARKIDLQAIENEEDYLWNALGSKVNEIYVPIKSLCIQDDSCKWGCIIDFALEWVVFGIATDFLDIYKMSFINNDVIEGFRYADIQSAISCNFATGTSAKIFKDKLKENYPFYKINGSFQFIQKSKR